MLPEVLYQVRFPGKGYSRIPTSTLPKISDGTLLLIDTKDRFHYFAPKEWASVEPYEETDEDFAKRTHVLERDWTSMYRWACKGCNWAYTVENHLYGNYNDLERSASARFREHIALIVETGRDSEHTFFALDIGDPNNQRNFRCSCNGWLVLDREMESAKALFKAHVFQVADPFKQPTHDDVDPTTDSHSAFDEE